MFYKLRPYLHEDIELIPIEIAGRGSRFGEDFNTTIEAMAADAYSQISHKLAGSYAILGYSMGGLIAYELNQIICSAADREGLSLPLHLIYAAITPPHVAYKFITEPVHLYDDEKFIDEVIALGGISVDDLTDKYILLEFVDILRNDFNAVWQYETTQHDVFRHQSYIDVLFSNSEDEEGIREWSQYTDKTCSFYHFNSGHFFILSHVLDMANVLNGILMNNLLP